MPRRWPTFAREFISYVSQLSHGDKVLLAAAGGYGAALAIWELGHAAGLEAFILKNELSLDLRKSLAVGLLAGAAAGLILWIVLGLIISRRPTGEWRWDQAARLVSLGVVLPLLPILALPGISARAPFFTLALVAVAAVQIGIIIWSLKSGNHSEDPAAPEILATESAEGSPVEPSKRLDRVGLALTIVLTVVYVLFMGALSIARHNAYLTNAFDLGIHDQAIYNIMHSGYMRSTLYGTYAIDYIGDHFSPILYLLAPIYALNEDARTLLALQTLFLAAAAIPLYLLAHLKTRSVWIALALVVAYLLHPALHGVNLDDFHQLALVILFLLSALYFLETERLVPFVICLVLALFVKEEVALTVAAIGAYVVFAKRHRGLGAALMLGGLLYFGVVIGWVMPRLGGTPQIDTRYGAYIASGTGGAPGVAWTLLTNPVFTAVQVLGNPEKVTFLLQVFLPVIFLPLLAAPVAWLVALPALAIQTITNAHTQYDINGHYTAHLLPLVFFLAVLALGRIKAATKRGRVIRGAVAIVLVLSTLCVSYLYSRAFPVGQAAQPWPKQDPHDRVVDRFVAELPEEATVSTLGGIAPHLTARKTIYLFPDVGDAEYLLLDTDPSANYWPYEGLKARDRSLVSMAEQVRSGVFGLVRAEDGVFLFQRGRDVRDNEVALRQMLSTRYEAEVMRSDFEGSVTADAEASGGKARRVTPQDRREDGKAAVVYGPYTDLQPGKYRATFVVRAQGVPPDARALTVDVFTHKDGYPRAVRELYGRDFSTPTGYQAFSVDFDTSGQTLEDVEFRATSDFVGELWIDLVELDYLG